MAWYWLCLEGVVFTCLVVSPGGALGDQTLSSKGIARVIQLIQENITTRCIFIHHMKDHVSALHQDAVLMDVTKLVGSPKVVISRNTSEQLHSMKDLNLCSNSRPMHLVLTKTGCKDARNLSSLSLWNDSMWLVAADDSSKSYIESSACQWHYHLLLMAQLIEDMLHISEISCLHGEMHKTLFAVWSKRDDLEIFAEEKIGLNGLVLRAATLQVPRITSLVTSVNSSQHQILDGMFGEVWQVLEKKLNFTTQFVIPEDEAYGQPMSDGGWNGVVGMVMRHEVDVGVAPITMSLDRNDVIDFTIPLLMSNYVIMIRKPNNLMINWYGFLQPFDSDLWLMMIVIIVLVSVSNVIMCKLVNHYFVCNAEDLNLVGDIFFSFFGIIFCYQGMDRPPKSIPCRIVCVLTYLNAVVLLAAYSGALISFITVKKTSLPFTNLEELSKDGSYQFGVVQSTSEDTLFKEAKDPLLKKVYQNLMLPDAGNFVMGELEGLQRACEMDYAFLSSYEEVVDYFPKVNCTIVILPQVFFKSAIALVLPKGSPYLNMFNNKINNLRLSGVMGRLYRRAWPRDEVSAEVEEETKVDMINVTPVFCILVGGILMSILILAAEHLVRGVKWDRSIDVSPSDTLHEILYSATAEGNSLHATPTTPRRYIF